MRSLLKFLFLIADTVLLLLGKAMGIFEEMVGSIEDKGTDAIIQAYQQSSKEDKKMIVENLKIYTAAFAWSWTSGMFFFPLERNRVFSTIVERGTRKIQWDARICMDTP